MAYGKNDGGWMGHGEDTIKWVAKIIILLAVVFLIVANIVGIVPAGNSANTLQNVSNAFNKSVNTNIPTIFTIAFVVVIVLLSGIILRAVSKTER